MPPRCPEIFLTLLCLYPMDDGNSREIPWEQDIPTAHIVEGLTVLHCEPTRAVNVTKKGEKEYIPGNWHRCLVADVDSHCFVWITTDVAKRSRDLVQANKTVGIAQKRKGLVDQHIYRASPWMCRAPYKPSEKFKEPAVAWKFESLKEMD